MSSPSHSAASSALGYLYQSQWPLLELLRRSDERPDAAITLELHDDVAWETGRSPVELLQLKHHTHTGRSLGDKDMDIWRTIRAWMDTVSVSDPAGPLLTMVTTQIAAAGSAAALLRPTDRDPVEACRLLENAAVESKNEASASNREAFLNLTAAARAVFVGRIYVLDNAPHIGDLDDEIRRALRFVLPRGHEDTFMGLLWNWWHAKAVDLLLGKQRAVTAVDVMVQVDDIRDQFAHDNLPTLVGPDSLDATEQAAYLDHRFVHQMRWVGMPPVLIQKAIIDYYRAYQQSAGWVEDDLIGWDKLASFEDKLRDEWEREFEWMIASLPPDADDSVKQEAGRQLLRDALGRAFRIRERYNEPFFCRGKHHELADRELVGWHPEFRILLESLLLPAVNA
ncbi:ABC-three component system protein [Actinoplanes awajinensis]|uniref:ABC-three component systems C-terminal domain-containing protein n=1 Tax=Actinoplanes awajinensis subsp. mycoplanecinus TaxID=135947 RepID=A0A124G7H4_9ACTN|nr:ABC-three component system protein [Actinoplanes awajinensis]KUL22841.1 hypothetical protein ADL15_47505 [Actinoplanes awajinensis subsp. mycoplanecinus]